MMDDRSCTLLRSGRRRTMSTGGRPSTTSGHMRYRTAQAAVAEMLRTEILSGQLQAGGRLLQADVAERFDTSTTPVREALRQLISEGLLDGDPHRGVTVHETSVGELQELYEIRMVLEPFGIAATVGNIPPAELERADHLVGLMESRGDPAEWTLLNAEFHATLAAAARRPRLTSILNNLRNLSAIYVAESIT